MDWQAVGLTVRLAGVTTVLLMMVGLPLAWWLAGSQGGMVRPAVRAMVGLPLVLPPTVLGFYLLVDLGPLTSVGRGLVRVLGHPLAFSFEGLVVGSMLYSLPFAVQPMVAGFAAVRPAVRRGREYAGGLRLRGCSGGLRCRWRRARC